MYMFMYLFLILYIQYMYKADLVCDVKDSILYLLVDLLGRVDEGLLYVGSCLC